MRAVIVIAALMFALPAQAHTEAEQREWKQEWVDEVKSRGLPRSLLAEYLEFQERHAPPPPIQASARSIPSGVFRGTGSDVEQWRGLVSVHFTEVDRALCIMAAESGGNPNAVNPRSGAAGLFQIMPFWWDRFGGDRFDPATNVSLAATILGLQGWQAWSPYNRGRCR